MRLPCLQLSREAGRSNRFSVYCSRAYSNVTTTQIEEVDVAVGSSGSIKLDIIRSRGTPRNPSLLIYLPRGPLASVVPETRSLALLGYASNATVIRINYRISSQWPFPTPVHDVMAGYDWILRSLLPKHDRNDDQQEPAQVTKLGVCGELLGGTLAAMLALTECHIYQMGIGAAYLGNAIVDWTAMHPVQRSSIITDGVEKKRSGKRIIIQDSWREFAFSEVLPTADLLRVRSMLFRSSEHYFDSFASPLLFFRTPSSDVPPSTSGDDVLIRFDHEESLFNFVKKRRAYKRYPTLRSSLRLPPLHMSVGRNNVLRDQGIEFAGACRRSIALYEERSKDRDIPETEAAPMERITFAEKAGLGLWDDEELNEIGTWFRESLE